MQHLRRRLRWLNARGVIGARVKLRVGEWQTPEAQP